MAISQAFNGSASIGTTEYDLPSASTSLSSRSDSGIYQAYIDLSALEATEEYRLRIYEKCRSTSTQRVIQEVIFSGAQTAEPLYVIPGLIFMHGWTITLKKNQGFDRTIEWSIRKVA